MCVCVCERERERERPGVGEGGGVEEKENLKAQMTKRRKKERLDPDGRTDDKDQEQSLKRLRRFARVSQSSSLVNI